jgi:hypothetical protein
MFENSTNFLQSELDYHRDRLRSARVVPRKDRPSRLARVRRAMTSRDNIR